MGRKIILVVTILAVAYVLWLPSVRQPAAEQTKEVSEVISTQAAAPVSAAEVAEVREEEPVAELTREAETPLPAVTPRLLWPNARVISRVEMEPDAQGRVKVIKTVETRMKQKYVRIEETYVNGRVESANLVQQNAMVANQILAQKPRAMGEERFVQILGESGAHEIKKIGDNFLVTFTAQPQNPQALDSFLTRVKAAVSGLVVEPNYIRRLF